MLSYALIIFVLGGGYPIVVDVGMTETDCSVGLEVIEDTGEYSVWNLPKGYEIYEQGRRPLARSGGKSFKFDYDRMAAFCIPMKAKNT